MQCVKLLSAMLESDMDVGSSLGCSFSDTASCLCVKEGSRRWPKSSDSCQPHRRDKWSMKLQPNPALAQVVM